MIILDSTVRSLEVDLAGAITTNQLPVVVSYVDITTTTYVPGCTATATNNTTAVTIAAAPGASTQRHIKYISVQNQDTVNATVTLQYNDNTTIRQLIKVTLNSDDVLFYTDGEGFRVVDSSGNIKTSFNGAPDTADYLVVTANASLSAERVITNSTSNTWDTSVAGQVQVQRAALTGDVTASANANATTIANDAVTFAKMQNIATDRLLGRDTAASGDVEELSVANGIEFSGSTSVQLTTPARTRTITFVIDGGGATITTGIKGDIEIPFACTITAATLLADQSGSIVIDIWKDTYANYPPTVADTITAAAKPTLSTATKSQDTTLTGWTTSITAGDTLRFNVDSITTCTRVTLSLKVTVA